MGTADVEGLLQSISSKQLGYWLEYDRQYGPIGDERQHLQLALIGAQICRLLAASKDAKKITLEQFLIGKRTPQTPKQQKSAIKMAVARQRAHQMALKRQKVRRKIKQQKPATAKHVRKSTRPQTASRTRPSKR